MVEIPFSSSMILFLYMRSNLYTFLELLYILSELNILVMAQCGSH